MSTFLNELISLEQEFGTGVNVTRTTTTYSSDPSVATARPIVSTSTILNDIRFIEQDTRQIKELLDQWGLQQGRIYELHFRSTDNIQLEDIVEFNTYKEKQKTAFDSSLHKTRIRLKELRVGYGDHFVFIGVTQ